MIEIYEFPIEIDLAKLEGKVASVVEGVNDTLSMCGIAERICFMSNIGTIELTFESNQSKEELDKMRLKLQEYYDENKSEFNFKIGSPRRKSGNAQQSVE